MNHQSGRHFLQIPGPTNVPDRVLRAIDSATIDHRGPEFQQMAKEVLAGLKQVFKTKSPVVIFPASGTGAWEAALVNTLSPGDRVLMYETGHFATLVAEHGGEARPRPRVRRGRLAPRRRPRARSKRGSRTTRSTPSRRCASCTTRPPPASPRASREVRKAIDRAKHPALFMVDTISSLASIDYRHDEWGVDVTVAGSQKGLMLPPGLSFNAVSDKALAAAKSAKLPRSYWNWEEMIAANKDGWFPVHAGDQPALRPARGAQDAGRGGRAGERLQAPRPPRRGRRAARCARGAWRSTAPNPAEYSSSLTAVLMPEGHSEIAFRKVVLEHFNLSLGSGLTKLRDKVFRIGHLGDFNDLMLCGTLCGRRDGPRARRRAAQEGRRGRRRMDYLARSRRPPAQEACGGLARST